MPQCPGRLVPRPATFVGRVLDSLSQGQLDSDHSAVATEKERAGQGSSADGPSAPLAVLIVDDCPDTTSSLAMLAQQWGFRAHVANDGPAALQIAAEQRPRVVLLDVGMPQMSGWELARRLRDLKGMENAYLVAVTGFGQATDEQHSREAGCDMHLTKPADPEELLRILQELANGEQTS